MRRRLLDIAAIGRATGFAAVVTAIIATVIPVRYDDTAAGAPLRDSSTHRDPLGRELARCQAIGMAAKDDGRCEAAWAENRRRFFAFHRPTEISQALAPSSTSPTEGR